MLKESVEKLSTLSGISGRENAVRDYIISEIKDIAEYKVDPLGNVIVFKKGKRPPKNKVMLDAHMDEVGFIVTYVTDDGLLKFSNVGGINTKVFVGKTVKVGSDGITGVVGIVPIHLTDSDKKRDIPDKDSLYIDIGASSKEDALKHVRPGDSICFDSDYVEFGENYVKCKALDDRVGCAILLEMIKSELEYDMYFSFSVQEEIGLRGAAVSSFEIAPDYAICVETTTASDIPGVENEKRVCLLGDGAVVSFMDRSTVYNKELFDRAFEIAKEYSVRIQTKTVVAGGNNAGAIHKSRGGVKILTVSVPCRYLHSPSCVINWNDAEESRKIIELLSSEFANA
ncbi:MAG: M42 family metallopeptidase [Clostridia bacterium]|nr:M42 family metallopeptidase [Clostridia bacterium]